MAKRGAAGAHLRHPSYSLHNGPTQLTGRRVRQAACRTLVRRKAENSVDGNGISLARPSGLRNSQLGL
jgi:hypothetical protein